MHTNIKITASMVLYKEDSETLYKTIKSFLDTPIEKKLYLVDNSPTDTLKKYADSSEIEYIFNNANVGFGRGHNTVLDHIHHESEYHLILNPDVVFEPTVLSSLIEELDKKQEVAMISPRVIYPNGKLQYTCRKHPTFVDLFSRKLGVFKKKTHSREYRDKDLTEVLFPDFIHGCFLLFRTKDLIDTGGFDERFFLYMEDADICRKIDKIGKKKMYYPKEQVVHIHRRGSSKNIGLFFRHFVSAIKYFNKWGY